MRKFWNRTKENRGPNFLFTGEESKNKGNEEIAGEDDTQLIASDVPTLNHIDANNSWSQVILGLFCLIFHMTQITFWRSRGVQFGLSKHERLVSWGYNYFVHLYYIFWHCGGV